MERFAVSRDLSEPIAVSVIYGVHVRKIIFDETNGQ